MELSIFISNIILSMREFQEKNGIKKQCVTNTQYLYDCIKMNFNNANVKAKALLVASLDIESGTFVITAGHLVVILDDEIIIDASHDVFSLKNKTYFHNVNDLISNFHHKDKLRTNFDIKELIHNHLHFMKLAEQINNGACIKSNKKFYNDQADYIDKLLHIFLI